MLAIKQIAEQVSLKLATTADRYTQIASIKRELIAAGKEIFATDRETIDGILDILFYEYGFQG